MLRSFCDRYVVKIAFQDPGRSTSLHSKILSLQSRSDVRLHSYRDNLAPTESVQLQETIPTQLGSRRSVLVTRLALEHIPNAIICVGAFRSNPFRFVTHYALLVIQGLCLLV